MLRIHFTTRRPDPHPDRENARPVVGDRLQSPPAPERTGRRAFAEWHRAARLKPIGAPLGTAVRKTLFQVAPRAHCFPDFPAPPEAEDGLDAGCTAILETPPDRVRREVAPPDRAVGAPARAVSPAPPPRRPPLHPLPRPPALGSDAPPGAGVELAVVKKMLGHAHIGVTTTAYAHVRLRLQRDAIGTLDRALDHP